MWWKIIIVVIIVLLLVRLLLRSNARKSMNPIDSIDYNGTLGFRIGDSIDFVLTRIKHLNLLPDDELKKFFDKEMGHLYRTMGIIDTTKKLFENIEDVAFFISSDKLRSILIKFNISLSELGFMKGVVERRISSKLGNPYLKYDNSINWRKGNNSVLLKIENGILSIHIS